MNVTWEKSKVHLNQEYNNLTMCLLKKVNDNYEAITVACMCKDYFQDSFFMARMKDQINSNIKAQGYISCYGYTVKLDDPNLDELNKDILYIGIKSTIDNVFDINQAEYSKTFMNYYDKLFNISPTNVYLSDDNLSLIFEYSKEWTNKLYMLSLFTLLSRCSTHCNTNEVTEEYLKSSGKFFKYVNSDKKDDKNAMMFNSAVQKINKLLDNNYIIKESHTYESINTFFSVMDLHHYSGILSLTILKSNEQTKEAMSIL